MRDGILILKMQQRGMRKLIFLAEMVFLYAVTIMYDKEIYLVDEVESEKEDEYGDPVSDRILKQRFADLKSISQTEFYQAQTNDYKPELKFELADYLDYAGEKKVVYEGFVYKVLRTFVIGRKIEITCYGGVRDASA